MKEFLESVQSSSQALAVVCATLLVFAISAEEVPWLERSLAKLRSAKNDLYATLDDQVRARLNSDAPISYFQAQIRHTAKQSGLSFTPDFNGLKLPYRIVWPDFASHTLSRCRQLLSESHETVFVPTVDELNDALYPAIDEAKLRGDVQIVGVHIDLPDDDQSLDELVSNLVLSVVSSELPRRRWEIKRLIRVRGYPLSQAIGQKVSLRSWFTTDREASQLVEFRDDQLRIFPDVEPVWDDVRHKTVPETIDFLGKRKREGTQEVELVGMRVTQRMVGLVGPTVVFVFLLFFWRHVAQLGSLTLTDVTYARSFPWIGLYPDRISISITFGSIVLLPMAAQAGLAWLTWTGRWTSWYSLGLCLLTGIVSILLFTDITRIRRKVIS